MAYASQTWTKELVKDVLKKCKDDGLLGGGGGSGDSADITYDNSDSNLESVNVQDAIDELDTNKLNIKMVWEGTKAEYENQKETIPAGAMVNITDDEEILVHIKDIQDLTNLIEPIGKIISFMGTIAPSNYLVCDGTEYNIADYPKLAEHFITQFGLVNYFGGDGITTFAVPDLNNKFLKGSNTPGIIEEAGLPNITGSFNHDWGNYLSKYASQLGCMYSGGNISNNGTSGGGTSDAIAYIDASRCSAIYGKSDTVTPENISVLYCIKYQ